MFVHIFVHVHLSIISSYNILTSAIIKIIIILIIMKIIIIIIIKILTI